MTYASKLKDPRWQKRRLEIPSRDNFTCRLCGDKTTELHVHHAYYERGYEPWDYPDDMLITFCEPCHDQVTELVKSLSRGVSSPEHFKIFLDTWKFTFGDHREYGDLVREILAMLLLDPRMVRPLYDFLYRHMCSIEFGDSADKLNEPITIALPC